MAQRKKTPAKSTAVAKRETTAIASISEERRADLLRQQTEGLAPTFPIVKILHAGAEMFELADGSKSEELSAIILDRHPANAYWKDSFDQTGGGSFPDCVSFDGVNGDGDPGGLCANCPMNEFGSAPSKKKGQESRGKACKNTERIYLLFEEDDQIPCQLIVPPTSIQVVSMYCWQLRSRGILTAEIFTRLSLKEGTNPDGIKYSKLVLSIDPEREVSGGEAVERILMMQESLMDSMRGERLTREQFGVDTSGSDESEPATTKGTKRPARRRL